MARREKHQKLEQTARIKMEQTIHRLVNENELLQRQVEKLNLVVVHHQVEPEPVLQYKALMNDILPQRKRTKLSLMARFRQGAAGHQKQPAD